ncbi:MAG: hypothetical protein JW892_16930 [Anaerolineae bacterium]|nr:hypothetical protein [Anaerolineae bacterium]
MSTYNWPEPHGTVEEWRRLFKAAEAFKAAAPWDWMSEELLFAVQNLETGEVGFCSITGEIGEHYALIVYLGEAGLGTYLTAVRGMKYASAFLEEHEHGLMLLEVPQLQASFESRGGITELDWQIVKDIKVRIRGRKLWPIFRVFSPGRLPWHITGPQARFLTSLLEQSLIVAQAQQRGEVSILPLADIAALPTTLPLLLREFEGGEWVFKQQVFSPQYPVMVSDNTLSAEDFANLRRKLPLKDDELQVHLAMLSMPVEEGDLPPYLPYTLLVVDSHQGIVLDAKLLLAYPSLADLWPQVLPALLALFERREGRPKRMRIASERLYNLLAMPMGQLGIKISRVQNLPELEEVYLDLEAWTKQQ